MADQGGAMVFTIFDYQRDTTAFSIEDNFKPSYSTCHKKWKPNNNYYSQVSAAS